MASVFSAVLLVLLVAVSAPLLAQLPLAAIAAMLLLASAGMLSLVAYLYHTSRPAVRSLVPDRNDPGRCFTPLEELTESQPECPQLKLVRIEGAVYFGAVQHVTDHLHDMRSRQPAQKHLLAMTRSMNFIDLAGAELWEHELAERRAAGGDLYVRQAWDKSGFSTRLGDANIFRSKDEALHAVLPRLDQQVCAGCSARIFRECGEKRFIADLHGD